MKRIALLLSAACFVVSAGGCAEYYHLQGLRKVKAMYDPAGRTMLIIPFKDPIFDYFESSEGCSIAVCAGDYIARHRITPVLYEGFFPEKVKAAYGEQKADFYEALKAAARAAESELVLVGQINEIHDGNPQDVGVIKGSMFISAQLYDMKADARPVWYMRREKIIYPEGLAYQAGVPATDMTRAELRHKMLVKAGETIGKAFRDHLEPIK